MKLGAHVRASGGVWSAVNALRHANRDARAGLALVGFGWLLMLPIALVNIFSGASIGLPSCVFRVVIMLSAIFGMVLGAQVLNIRRVPKWARVYVEGPRTKVAEGVSAVLLGLALMAAVIVL